MPAPAGLRLDPPDLSRAVRRIVVDGEAEGRDELEPFLDRANQFDIPVEQTDVDTVEGSINKTFREEKRTLRLSVNKGSFIKPWESSPHLIGDDEWCLTPVEGCPLDCSYCYLQDYLDRPLVTAFVNQQTMREHVTCFLDDPPDGEEPPHYFSLGELSDGLFLEPLLKSLPVVWDIFRDQPDAHLEIRTKSHHVHGSVSDLEPHGNGVFTWSLSPEDTARSDEMLTAPLDQRIEALSRVNEAGFRVAVRLDPILYRDGWETEYRQLLDQLFTRVSPDDLDFVILGTFRFPRGFDRTIEERFPNRNFLREEFVEGPDGKFRYPRSLRTEVFDTLSGWLEGEGIDPDLCMEPDYVWEDAEIEKTPGEHA